MSLYCFLLIYSLSFFPRNDRSDSPEVPTPSTPPAQLLKNSNSADSQDTDIPPHSLPSYRLSHSPSGTHNIQRHTPLLREIQPVIHPDLQEDAVDSTNDTTKQTSLTTPSDTATSAAQQLDNDSGNRDLVPVTRHTPLATRNQAQAEADEAENQDNLAVLSNEQAINQFLSTPQSAKEIHDNMKRQQRASPSNPTQPPPQPSQVSQQPPPTTHIPLPAPQQSTDLLLRSPPSFDMYTLPELLESQRITENLLSMFSH